MLHVYETYMKHIRNIQTTGSENDLDLKIMLFKVIAEGLI